MLHRSIESMCDNPAPSQPAPSMISLARYAALPSLATAPAIAASLLGRLPIGIAGLAILMLAQNEQRLFRTGGAAAACYVAGLAAVAPLLGRA